MEELHGNVMLTLYDIDRNTALDVISIHTYYKTIRSLKVCVPQFRQCCIYRAEMLR